jgi:hypothetical protein
MNWHELIRGLGQIRARGYPGIENLALRGWEISNSCQNAIGTIIRGWRAVSALLLRVRDTYSVSYSSYRHH